MISFPTSRSKSCWPRKELEPLPPARNQGEGEHVDELRELLEEVEEVLGEIIEGDLPSGIPELKARVREELNRRYFPNRAQRCLAAREYSRTSR